MERPLANALKTGHPHAPWAMRSHKPLTVNRLLILYSELARKQALCTRLCMFLRLYAHAGLGRFSQLFSGFFMTFFRYTNVCQSAYMMKSMLYGGKVFLWWQNIHKKS